MLYSILSQAFSGFLWIQLSMLGAACWGFRPTRYPTTGKSQRINHTEISISYKADWPIRSGYLLVLMTYLNPLSLSTLATRLSTFLSWAGCILPLRWSAQEWPRELPDSSNTLSLFSPPLLPVWLSRLYCLPGQSAFY